MPTLSEAQIANELKSLPGWEYQDGSLRKLFRFGESPISGQDIRAHRGDPERAIYEVRDWLRLTSKRTTLPGGREIINHYHKFHNDLPDLCAVLTLEPDGLTFLDLSKLITDWLRTSR